MANDKIFEETLTEDGFGVRIVARADASMTDWLSTLNSSIGLSVDAKVPGDSWREIFSDTVGLAYEDWASFAGYGVGFKVSEIEQTGDRSGRVRLKLKAKINGKKTTLDQTWVHFSV